MCIIGAKTIRWRFGILNPDWPQTAAFGWTVVSSSFIVWLVWVYYIMNSFLDRSSIIYSITISLSNGWLFMRGHISSRCFLDFNNILCPKTLLFNGETTSRHTFLCRDSQFFAPWRSHNPVRKTCVSYYWKIIHLHLINWRRILNFFFIINSLSEEENLEPQ